MNRAILLSLAVIFFISAGQAAGQTNIAGINLACTLKPGIRLALEIDRKTVLESGRAMKNLDRKSVVVGSRYITFSQKFDNYKNSWRISRNSLKVSFKTVLKRDSRIVLDEKGTCATAVAVTTPRSSAYALLANVIERLR